MIAVLALAVLWQTAVLWKWRLEIRGLEWENELLHQHVDAAWPALTARDVAIHVATSAIERGQAIRVRAKRLRETVT